MYRSPIRLAGLETATSYDKQTLSLAKKKMLAELELGDGHAVVIDGTELNRQDIIKLFDELGNEEKLAFHAAISNDTVLLQFLETGMLPGNNITWQKNELYDTAAFRHFVSPYFAAATAMLYQYILSGRAGAMLSRFVKYPSFLMPADYDTAFGKTTRHFLEIKNRILLCQHSIEEPEEEDESGPYYTEPGKKRTAEITVTKEEIEGLCSNHEIFVLNRMPEEFDDLRHSIASAFNNICVCCDHINRYQLAYAAVCKAAEINCPALEELIRNNKAVVYNKLQPQRTFSTPPPQNRRQQEDNPLRWIGIVAFAIISIIRMANLGSCNHSSSRFSGMDAYETINSAKVNDEQVTNIDNYHNLVAALYDLEADSGHVLNTPSDSQIALLKGNKNGMDILKNVWTTLGFKTKDSMLQDVVHNGSYITIRNKSSWPAVIIYLLDREYFGSVYVRPHSSYRLNHDATSIMADVYSGTDWSDSVTGRMYVQMGHSFSSAETLRGRFKTHSGYNRSARNSFFYRSADSTGVYHDSIIITDDSEHGTSFANIQNLPEKKQD